MNKFFFSCIIFFCICQQLSAQITIYGDLKNQALTYYNDIIISTSGTNSTTFSGSVKSNTGDILIKPVNNETILIIPPNSANTGSPTSAPPPTAPLTVIVPGKKVGTDTGTIQPPPYNNFKIYPNPVQTNLTFESPSQNVIAYSIYNSNGILMTTNTIIASSTYTVNVVNLVNGTYILALSFENNQYLNVQFIKQ